MPILRRAAEIYHNHHADLPALRGLLAKRPGPLWGIAAAMSVYVIYRLFVKQDGMASCIVSHIAVRNHECRGIPQAAIAARVRMRRPQAATRPPASYLHEEQKAQVLDIGPDGYHAFQIFGGADTGAPASGN